MTSNDSGKATAEEDVASKASNGEISNGKTNSTDEPDSAEATITKDVENSKEETPPEPEVTTGAGGAGSTDTTQNEEGQEGEGDSAAEVTDLTADSDDDDDDDGTLMFLTSNQFLGLLAIFYFFLWSEPAGELLGFLFESTASLIKSICCVLYNPVCTLDEDNPVNASLRPKLEELLQPHLSANKTCSAECAKQIIQWCEPDQKILIPDLLKILYLSAKIIMHGFHRIGGKIWSMLSLLTDVICTSILLAIMVILSMSMMAAIMRFVFPVMKAFLKGFVSALSKPAEVKKGSPTHTAAARKRKRNDATTTSRNGSAMSSSSMSLFSLFGGLLDAIDEGCDSCTDTLSGNTKIGPNTNKACTLADYKGATEAKKELQLVIDFLKNPKKYSEFGARLPRGVLLYGPPGTGKTLFARTLAGEAKVAFIHKCASEFRSMFVGSGAKNIRTLFSTARKHAPCIIFIDEIDSISKRTSSEMHPYANQAINQLLFEMDGFIQNDSAVVVVGATNRLDNIDPALLRPGRFDTVVRVDLPNLEARKEILEHYVKQLKKVGEVDISVIASKTDEYSGAELEYLVNESALLAASQAAEKVEQKHLEEALGKRKKSLEEMKEFDSVNYKPFTRQAIAHMYN